MCHLTVVYPTMTVLYVMQEVVVRREPTLEVATPYTLHTQAHTSHPKPNTLEIASPLPGVGCWVLGLRCKVWG